MITPLLHITMPENFDEDEHDEERHFAPIILALQAPIAINRWHILRSWRRYFKGLGPPLPLLYESGVRYKEDPPGQENWKDCWGVLKDGFGDCLPLSTLVLRDDFSPVPLGALRPGDRILEDGAWTQVHDVMCTGEKALLAFKLSNGCSLRCSADHRVFRDVAGKVEEVRAAEVRIGDDLVTGSSIPMPEMEGMVWPDALAKLAPQDRAWLLGVFVADGWTEVQRCSIAGRDGKSKESQKRRVESLLQSVGIPTRWHERYVSINDLTLAEFFEQCGRLAPNKHLPSICFSAPETVQSVLEGLAADASFEKRPGKTETVVYGTTSSRLALQLRLLYRMLGVSTSIRRVDNHGGLGTNPIYRVTPRLKTRAGYAPRREKLFARVRAIADGGTELCGDITTASGKFWLPESDVLVHNCDRLVSWRVAELQVLFGIQAEPIIKWQQVPKHIMVGMGHPPHTVPENGISMVHVCVGWPGWQQNPERVEDPSKLLGMGGEYTSGV